MANFWDNDQAIGEAPKASSGPWDNDPVVEAPEPSFFDKAKDTLVSAGAQAINPIGAGLETLNQIPVVQDYIPDFMADNTVGRAVSKGAYNAVRNTAQLGADIQDYMIPGDQTPMSDLLSHVPEAEYSGTLESVGGHITEIASGFLLGNKLGAAAKTAKLGEDAVIAAEKFAPEVAMKLIKFLTPYVKGGAQGVVGTAVTTKPGSTNLVVGDDALIEKLGLNPLLQGLPMDSPDAAENALAARINTAIDGFITGAGITGAAKGLKTLYHALPGPAVVEKIAPIFSNTAKIKTFFEQIGTEFQKLKGGDTPEGLQNLHKRAAELAKNVEAGTLKKDLGIPGVQAINEPLDTATTVGRQVSKVRPDEIDQGIKSVLEGQAKKIGQKGFEQTALRREGPTRALSGALEQTEQVLGGPTAAQTGAREVQRLGEAEVTKGKTQGMLTQNEINQTGTVITENVNRARELRTESVNQLYDKIPVDVKYEGASINKIIADNKDAIPDEIITLLGKDSDGSFKFLNNKVRPRVTAMIKKLEKATNPLTRDQRQELTALKALRDNIDTDQIKALTDAGRSDAVSAAKTAKEAYEAEVAQNRQGIVGDIQDIESKEGLNQDEIFTQSREKLKKEIGNLEHPEHNKRLYDVLESDEGGRSSGLIERYKNAKDKVTELENIENEIYGNKLREFYDKYDKKAFPEGTKSFEDLLADPQSGDRIKYIVDLAEKDGTESVQKALQYSYARSFRKRLFTGHLTEGGAEVTNAPAVRSVLDNEGFLKAGDQIFKDNPDFMVAVKDTLELANDIQRSSYLKAAPKGEADMVSTRAQKGLNTALAPIFGPLSHKGYIAKTFFKNILEVLTPQTAVDRMADALLADGQKYAEAYARFVAPKANKRATETATKVLINSLLRTDGEREKFNKKFSADKTAAETDEVLKK